MAFECTSWILRLNLLAFAILMPAGCGAPENPPARADGREPVFTVVTAEAGLGQFRHNTGGFGESLMPEIVGGGGGFIDYDGDGWEDILLVAGGTWPHHTEERIQGVYLYRNNGDGSFEDVSAEAGLGSIHTYGFGITVADYDNDGDQDFFLTTLYQNRLFRNEEGRFEDVAAASGLTGEAVWSTSAVFFDADVDGWLDLYVGNYVDWTPENDLECRYEDVKVFCTPQEYAGLASRFYHNNGDGTFTDQTEERGFLAGVDTTKDKTLGIAMLDYNLDGWIDITTGNDTENDMLYTNQGNGFFREEGLASGVAVSQHGRARAGMGVDAGVVDSSGAESIFVGNFSDESVSVFKYVGNGQFQDQSAVSRLAYPSNLTLTFGLALFDVDLDTDLDLLTANGHVLTHINKISQAIQFKQSPQMYLNRGNGVFDEYEPADSALQKPMVARGLAYSDYDRDGDLDVLFVENGGPAHLWRNDTAGGSYLRVRLEGVEANRDAVGARVEAVAGNLTMYRMVRTGGSFLSSSEKVLTFGLGPRDTVDTLRVFWPGGAVETFTAIEGNQVLHIKEGGGF